MSLSSSSAEEILHTIPLKYRGPGGAAAILKDGTIIAEHVWGYADLEQRIPMTSSTLMPICSITKQLVCATMVSLSTDPTPFMQGKGSLADQLDRALRSLLPPELTRDSTLTVDHLVDMHSGLRDYWALCTLWGSRPETSYRIETDDPWMRRCLGGSFHFEPGSEFSYSNTNFNIVGRLLETVAGQPLHDLLAQRVFGPAGMKTAKLNPRCDRLPPPCVAYEGSVASGFVATVNNIEWAGDAGAVASLVDMAAYERWFDEEYRDEAGAYRAAIDPPHKYNDGVVSSYRCGMGHYALADGKVATVGHGGALRGFRLHRRYAKKERVSVVVMFNHDSDAQGAANYIIESLLAPSHVTTSSALASSEPNPPSMSSSASASASASSPPIEPAPGWSGAFLDPDTQLLVRAAIGQPTPKGATINVSFVDTDILTLTSPTRATTRQVAAELTDEGQTLVVEYTEYHRTLRAGRLVTSPSPTVSHLKGAYRAAEFGSVMHVMPSGSEDVMYAAFDGPLGKGPPHLMTRIAGRVWIVADQRGMDAPAPGDWTVVFDDDGDGEEKGVKGLTMGCWLARRIAFVRSDG